MYAGTTFTQGSGRIVGVHQKIDRVARRHLKKYIAHSSPFPNIQDILHFEGINGPDGIKRKSPSRDEPWHFINPNKPEDKSLLVLINDNLFNLIEALRTKNEVRASYEAAWLAHAIVDGLTPAHHYPLDDKIEELWGKHHTQRLTKTDKNIIKGKNHLDTISKNWQYWGTGGVFTAHLGFELGVASTVAGVPFKSIGIVKKDFEDVVEYGFEAYFLRALHRVDSLKMYDQFGKSGWTHQLGNQTRKILIPEIAKTVCIAWFYAAKEAEIE